VSVELRRWQQVRGGSVRPGETVIGLALGQPSAGFREMACDLAVGAASSFAHESQLMNKWFMGPVSREKLRQVVEAEGQCVLEAQRQQTFALDWKAPRPLEASPTNAASAAICLGADGVMTRQITDDEKRKRRHKTAGKRGARAKTGKKLAPLSPRKQGADGPWKEVKIVGAYDAEHQHRHWCSTVMCHLMAAVLITQVARRVGLTPRHAVVAVIDGASWIAARLRECLPHLQAIILDFYHLSQHVHDAMRAVFGDGTPAAQQWAEQLLHTIRHQGFAAFDALLQTCLTDHAPPGGGTDANAAVTQLQQYVSQRQEMVNYPYFEAQGWPIGSGPTESMAGVLTARIKGRGRRWDADHIDAIMALQALEVNDEAQAYWQTQAPPRKQAA
jgi:hypothetical protein